MVVCVEWYGRDYRKMGRNFHGFNLRFDVEKRKISTFTKMTVMSVIKYKIVKLKVTKH